MSEVHLTIDTANFIRKLSESSTSPLYDLTPEQARQVLHDVQNVEVEQPAAHIEKIEIPIGDDKTLPALMVRPHSEVQNLPVIFYIHGGGWILGDEVTHERLIRQLAVGTEAAVVYPLYTPSPEAQYPQAIQELFAALKFIAAECENLHLDASRLVVAGDSVGGNMATVMALMAKENNNPKIAFQLLFYPVTNADFETQSYNDYAEGPWLTKKAMQWFWDAYCPNKEQRKEITASPLLAEVEHLEGMPPALIITDENDVLRDEGEAYARKLIQAGVDVSSVRINNTIHDFVMLNPIAKSKPARTAINLAIAILRRVFYKNDSKNKA